MAIFGLKVTESILPNARQGNQGIRECTIIGVGNGVSSDKQNTLIGVNSFLDFKVKVSGASTKVNLAVKTFYQNNPNGVLSFFACHDSQSSNVGEDLLIDHITNGISILDRKNDYELRFVLLPEMEDLTDQASRTNLYTLCHSLCVKKDWLFFVSSADGVDTKAEAIAERDLYSSALGHASYFYGRFKNSDDETVSLSPYVAAIALRRSAEDGAFKPPAGAKYPLSNAKELLYYIDTESEYNELQKKGINVMQDIPRYGFCLWGARTLSGDRNLLFINTRVAISVISADLEEGLTPFLFESYDPRGATGREVRRTVESIMNAGYLNGAFSGSSQDSSYAIVEQELDPTLAPENPTLPEDVGNPGNPITPPATVNAAAKKLYTLLRIYAHFVGATEQIEVRLFHTQKPEIYAV